jgi:8-oxo-dGTP pyrophosphatase MutT (NUDIX family)
VSGGRPADPGGQAGARPWDLLDRERIAGFEIFDVDRLRVRSPRTGQVFDRHVLHLPDWVTVVPVTPDGRIVMVEQFRFGAGIVSLEFPAGRLGPGEEPLQGGRRELLEETGYSPAALRIIGRIRPDPAIQDNALHVLAARDCRVTAPLGQDEGEDVHVRLLAPAAVRRAAATGGIQHALALAAWSLFELQRDAGPTNVPPAPPG